MRRSAGADCRCRLPAEEYLPQKVDSTALDCHGSKGSSWDAGVESTLGPKKGHCHERKSPGSRKEKDKTPILVAVRLSKWTKRASV